MVHKIVLKCAFCGCRGAIFLLMGILFACGKEENQLLDLQQILERTDEELQKQLGAPDFSFVRSERVSTMQWRDADGDSTWVYVDLVHGKAAYVTYSFKKLIPFDAAAALRRIGLQVPQQEPETVWENGAQRWKPFGKYQRLTVNPVTRTVSISLLDETWDGEKSDE